LIESFFDGSNISNEYIVSHLVEIHSSSYGAHRWLHNPFENMKFWMHHVLCMCVLRIIFSVLILTLPSPSVLRLNLIYLILSMAAVMGFFVYRDFVKTHKCILQNLWFFSIHKSSHLTSSSTKIPNLFNLRTGRV